MLLRPCSRCLHASLLLQQAVQSGDCSQPGRLPRLWNKIAEELMGG